jgi:hypothetical protein
LCGGEVNTAAEKAYNALHGSNTMRREAAAIGLVDEALEALRKVRLPRV